jgi:hypothetical protein
VGSSCARGQQGRQDFLWRDTLQTEETEKAMGMNVTTVLVSVRLPQGV